MAAFIGRAVALALFVFLVPSYNHAAKQNDFLSAKLHEVFPPEFFKPNGNPNSNPNDINLKRETSDDCTCVPVNLCEDNVLAVPEIHIRQSSDCDNYLEVCCKNPIPPESTNQRRPSPPANNACGQRNPFGVGFRITGADDGEAQFGEFPWMVSILRGTPKAPIYRCGGALIHPQVVLTAAHCVVNREKYIVRAGEWDTQTTKEVLPHQDRETAKVVIHPRYNSGALFNDAALLFLKTPVDPAGNVGTICLPLQGEIFDHSRCYASGWGRETYGKEGLQQMIMKKVELPVVPRDKCEASLKKVQGRSFELHRSFMCAGGEEGRDTCKGDGGSPLVCPIGDTGKYAQAGIVSWGIGCGNQGTPGIYADVGYLRNWIDDELDRQNILVDDLRPKDDEYI